MTKIEDVIFHNRNSAEILLENIIKYGQISEYDYEIYIEVFGKIEEDFTWDKKVIEYIPFNDITVSEDLKDIYRMMGSVAYSDVDMIGATIVRYRDGYKIIRKTQ